MSHNTSHAAANWSPTYFLASVGSGGLSVTFFMYLLFWVPHPGKSVPTFENIAAAWGTGYLPQQIAIAVAMLGIAAFGLINLRSLFWNFGQLAKFKKTPSYAKLRSTNAESSLLAAPLAVAMSVNAAFIMGLVFVPGLWNVIELLFPLAMATFVIIGLISLRMIGHFLGRVLSEGGIFDVTAHNSFAQLLPAFALAMTGVGLSAPAAMSTVPAVVGISLVLSTLFGVMSAIYALLAAVTAFNSMLHYGTAKEAGPTLMIIVPLLTILGILAMRQTHGLHVVFDVHNDAASTMMMITRLLSVQILFGLLGLVVLRRQGYAAAFLRGNGKSAGSYALVCPGVALSVMGQFWINKGLVAAGMIVKFGTVYWALSAVAIAFQVAMVLLVLFLNKKHFSASAPSAAIAAE
ncbi:MAG: hypothetical protein JKX69_11255 [Rhodobacteraceae bacterium]|nr:hypothetical protein [Paracoccaceae bacterium]